MINSRKHPEHRLLVNPETPILIFLTVCTKNRQPWLATEANHDMLRQIWRDATAWLVGRYVIMPDHIHLFASPGDKEIPIQSWVHYWKSQFTKKHRLAGGCDSHRWQTDFWDRQLRSEENYEQKWEYVRNNPVRHGLVTNADDWQFQGIIHMLPWIR